MTVHDISLSQSWRPSAVPRIAIAGRGFSGLMTAIALLKTVRGPFHLQMFDPNPVISGGQALASSQMGEILNSRVRDLSVSAGDPDDFNDWLCHNAEFRMAVPAAIPGFQQIFVPRGIFSDYAYQRFSEALAQRHDVTVQVRCDAVTAVRRMRTGEYLLETLEKTAGDLFDVVVMATGHGIRPETVLPADSLPTLVPARRLVDRPHTVLLGGGLRVVDRLLQLRDGGYTGQITIVSRHGFLPQSHTRINADPLVLPEPLPTNLRDIVRVVRKACADAEAAGLSWQSVMNGFRRNARSLWRSLPARQKHQFNRHLRAIYDSHRNRLPETHFSRLQRELADGHTMVRKGWAGPRMPTGLMVRWSGGKAEELVSASQVIDCRCPSPDLDTPLVQSLFAARLAVPDELNLGLLVNSAGEVLADNLVTKDLYAIGPLGLGSLPDIDLVPEIVGQAYAAAARIADTCSPRLKTG